MLSISILVIYVLGSGILKRSLFRHAMWWDFFFYKVDAKFMLNVDFAYFVYWHQCVCDTGEQWIKDTLFKLKQNNCPNLPDSPLRVANLIISTRTWSVIYINCNSLKSTMNIFISSRITLYIPHNSTWVRT